ncbi:hypothetical protein BDW42DRAFT_181277 [Aspergillus taichungensis]|uniref:Uncharacterized protein n=1 Tax=Aspergillus taichungensis TaxID=482145 RepID=A0A2J5HDZ9_9EURO|nr:hypothetical protein BDW42DRAFT_181277 [Aspergillus taichungensis]
MSFFSPVFQVFYFFFPRVGFSILGFFPFCSLSCATDWLWNPSLVGFAPCAILCMFYSSLPVWQCLFDDCLIDLMNIVFKTE